MDGDGRMTMLEQSQKEQNQMNLENDAVGFEIVVVDSDSMEVLGLAELETEDWMKTEPMQKSRGWKWSWRNPWRWWW